MKPETTGEGRNFAWDKTLRVGERKGGWGYQNGRGRENDRE